MSAPGPVRGSWQCYTGRLTGQRAQAPPLGSLSLVCRRWLGSVRLVCRGTCIEAEGPGCHANTYCRAGACLAGGERGWISPWQQASRHVGCNFSPGWSGLHVTTFPAYPGFRMSPVGSGTGVQYNVFPHLLAGLGSVVFAPGVCGAGYPDVARGAPLSLFSVLLAWSVPVRACARKQPLVRAGLGSPSCYVPLGPLHAPHSGLVYESHIRRGCDDGVTADFRAACSACASA